MPKRSTKIKKKYAWDPCLSQFLATCSKRCLTNICVLGFTFPHQIYTTLNFFTFLRAKVFFNGHQKRQFSTFTLNLDQNDRFSCLFVLLSTYLTWAGGGRGGGAGGQNIHQFLRCEERHLRSSKKSQKKSQTPEEIPKY